MIIMPGTYDDQVNCLFLKGVYLGLLVASYDAVVY